MSDVVIVAACRTPIGTIGGQFKTLTSLDLSVPVMQNLVKRAGISPEIIEDVKGNAKTVMVGVKVKVLDEEYGDECEYRVVGSTEADPQNGKISDESPVGRALIGKTVGDEVVVEAPGGEFKLKIVAISK